MDEISYTASKTGSKFHRSDEFVRALMGPFGSGKTVACVMDLLKRSYEQKSNAKGIRPTRWALVRNTYRELIDTTVKTFFEWIPQDLGVFVKLDMQFTLKVALADGTQVHAEFLFRALDRPEDIKKLLSLDLTGAFLNEARQVPKEIFEAVQGRCGRYPPRNKSVPPTWFGVMMDTNPPDSDHWWYTLFEEDKPEGHVLFKQPSGLSADAENKENLPDKYYERMCHGKDQEWINVYVHGQYGFVSDGKPVFPEYNDDLHFNPTLQLRASEDSNVVVLYSIPIGAQVYSGTDFGLTPAAAIGVKNKFGQLLILDELVTENMGAKQFAKLLHQKLNTRPWKGLVKENYGDPAGEQRAQTDEQTPFMIMSQENIDIWPTHTNDFTVRREVVAAALTTLASNGKPLLQIGPGAPMLRKALAGGYKYKRLSVKGESRFQDVPMKNKYSHVADALQYLCLGALGDFEVLGGFNNSRMDYALHNRGIV